MLRHTADTVLTFWFEETAPKMWWVKDLAFDTLIKQKFTDLLNQAIQGELYTWRKTPQGRLAEIIVLDQFSRNIHRDTPKAFSADAMALALAQEAVSMGADKQLLPNQQAFMYMPYMHSESKLIHQLAVPLFSQEHTKANLDFELRHQAIIEQFGRYPHRNEILGRTSTTEELAFLTQAGSSF